MLSWRGKDGAVPSRDAAGWGEVTLGPEPYHLGLGTAFATLRLHGPGEDKLSCLHIPTAPLSCQAQLFHGIVFTCTAHFPGKSQGIHCLWQLLPTCKCAGRDGTHTLSSSLTQHGEATQHVLVRWDC